MSLAANVIPGKSKRNDFPLQPDRCCLLIIDVQEYLSSPSDPSEAENHLFSVALPEAVGNISKLLTAFRNARDSSQQTGCEVIHTFLQALTNDCRDVSLDYKLSGPSLATIPNAATSPAVFLPEVSPSSDGKGDIVLPKTSCSVFQSTNLRYVLQNLGIEQVVVTGQLTDQCVESAVRDAADLGFFVTVAEDACAARTKESHQRGLSGMKGFCRILKTDEVLKELSGRT